MEFVSLVKRGANQLPVVYKDDEKRATISLLTKAGANFDEDGEILGVVYAPDLEDSQGDVADAAAIKKIQRESTKHGFKLDMQHDGKALSADRAWLAENLIIAKGDERFTGFKDRSGVERDVTGGWGIVVRVEDPELRKQYRSGAWDGFSMAGPAELQDITKDAASPQFERFIKAFETAFNQGGTAAEDEMTEAEMKKALTDNNAALSTSIVEALAKAGVIKAADAAPAPAAKPEPAPAAKPVLKFEGDPMNADDVKKHREKLAKAKLAEGVDWNDPDSVSKYEARLAEFSKSADGKPDPNAAQIAKLEDEIKKLRGASQQPTSGSGSGGNAPAPGATDVNGIKKEQQAAGSNIAKIANERRFGKKTG